MLVGLIGKAGSGKDTFAKIFIEIMFREHHTRFFNKKYAGKLKQIVSLLFGCTLEELEDGEFKKKIVPKEYHFYAPWGDPFMGIYPTLEDFNEDEDNKGFEAEKVAMDFRRVLTYLGTDLLRDCFHPNIWILALFADYKNQKTGKFYNDQGGEILEYPNWIITDVRFKNEADAIIQRGGILVKIDRDIPEVSTHISETDLDAFTDFVFRVDNNGTVNDLYEQVYQFINLFFNETKSC